MTLHKSKAAWAEKCPIRDVLDRTGDRWTVLVLHELEAGTLRFSALKTRIGDISQRMLAQTLRKLEEDGLVSREVFPTIPPRVEYTLTRLGHSFLVPVRGMMRWAEENQEAVHSARRAYVPPAKQVAK
ncbi:putative HTH-type transcriptional regulator YybR [Methylophilaceae bacterium]|nr:putative HTH-type transcriptional regulator YybR [Methylophilaceae bacterium]